MVDACNLHGIIVAMQLEKEPRRCCRTFIHSKVLEYYCLMINQNSNPNITNLLCCFHQYTAFIHRSFVLADLVFLLGTAIFLVMLCILVQLRSLLGNRNRHENSSKLANVASPGGPGEPSQLVEVNYINYKVLACSTELNHLIQYFCNFLLGCTWQ